MTPASVAWTPDSSTQNHSATPASEYAAIRVTPARFSATSAKRATPAAARAPVDSSLV